MKRLNIEISSSLAEILMLRDTNPAEYAKNIVHFLRYCDKWEK